MRARVHVVAIVLAVVTMTAFGRAEPVSSLKPTDCVNDFAGVLSPATVTQLKEMCRQVLDKAQATVVVATVKSTDGEDIFNYSVDLYQKWGIGAKGKDRGVLILLAVQDRKRSIRVGYGLEPILPDGKVGGFGREAVPYLQGGDYDGAVSLLASRVEDVIAKDAGVEITTSQPRRIEPLTSAPRDAQLSPGAIVAIIIVIVIVLAFPPAPTAVLHVPLRRRWRRRRRLSRRRWRLGWWRLRWWRRFRRIWWRQHGRRRRRRQLVAEKCEER